LLGRKGKVYCSNAKQGNLLNSIIICREEIKTALRIGLIQIHSKNETNTFEKIFWVSRLFFNYIKCTLILPFPRKSSTTSTIPDVLEPFLGLKQKARSIWNGPSS
jgi:hypothetical protein